MLTGAGCSAGSGIPTYRDRAGVWQRSEPIQHQDFLTSEATRKRYWLRSYAGWPAVANAEPGPSHHALARMEQSGYIHLLVTQNVDRLHQKALSEKVIDLHGRLDEVICLDCNASFSRTHIQELLRELNPHLSSEGALAPDGDADVDPALVSLIKAPACENCGGVLKPNVVFFGDNVDKQTVKKIYAAIDECDALLVIGSSLKVFSGFRYCRYAFEAGKPIASVNPGVTRADDLLALRIQAGCDEVLPETCNLLC